MSSLMTPEDMLRLWLDGGKVPSPYQFQPTPAEPVAVCQIGTIGGVPVMAHGVVHAISGFTGPWLQQVVTTREWRWYLDNGSALVDAHSKLFEYSAEARAWLAEPVPETIHGLYQQLCEARAVTPEIGAPFTLYRVVCQDGLGFCWQLCSADLACAVLHETMGRLALLGSIPAPSYEHPAEITVPFYQQLVGTCPRCEEKVFFYGTFYSHNGRKFIGKWYAEKVSAEKAYKEALDIVKQRCDEERRAKDQRAAMELCVEVWREADDLRQDQALRALKPLLPAALVSQFDNLYRAEHEEGDLDAYDVLRVATEKLRVALDATKAKLLVRISELNLVPRLGKLLERHLPCCPICQQGYARTEEWLKQVLLLGHGDLICACASAETKVSSTSASCLLGEISEFRDGLVIPVLKALEAHWSCVDIRRLALGAKPVIHLAVRNWHCSRPQSMVAVNREALETATGHATTIDVWRQTAEQLRRERVDKLEGEVAEGTVLKLRLVYQSDKQSWSSYRRVGGVVTVHAVRHDFADKVKEPGWYYCRVVFEPSRSQKPDFKLLLVNPLMPVPEECIPTQLPRRF